MADDLTDASPELRDAERQVERRSAVFRKELGLTDLALTQILFIVGLPWVGFAAKLGPSHIIFWLLAISLFYLPSAAVVIYLNRLMPLEGGLYQWAKLAFNSFLGFMVGWNLWLFVILNCSEIGSDDIDLIGPIPQVMSIGFGKLGFAAHIVPIAIIAFLGIRIAQSSVQFAGNTRLPMVAGWDRLLPEWFTRLHPKRKTPVNSIIFVGAITLAVGLAGLIGVGEQEAFQLLWNASGIFYALTYLVMFAIPLVGLKGTAGSAPLWLKLASASGLLMTVLYVGLGDLAGDQS
ncbi:MAG: amino acid permease [Blastocatellia bacterium]